MTSRESYPLLLDRTIQKENGLNTTLKHFSVIHVSSCHLLSCDLSYVAVIARVVVVGRVAIMGRCESLRDGLTFDV